MRSTHNLKKSSSWFWRLLSKSADLSKPWGRFFQILCVSQKVRTLTTLVLETFKLEMPKNWGCTFFSWCSLTILRFCFWHSKARFTSTLSKLETTTNYVRNYLCILWLFSSFFANALFPPNKNLFDNVLQFQKLVTLF